MDWNGGWRGNWDGNWFGDEGGASGPNYVYAELIAGGTGTTAFNAELLNATPEAPPAGNVIPLRKRPAFRPAPRIELDDEEEDEALILCRAI